MFPRGRKLLLGVAGGISAYKSCDLLRRLQDEGFIVDVVPTAASLNFVGKATWEALSGRKVITDLWSDVENVPHISMAKESDLIVIAPTTADLLAKLVSGRADDLLTNIVLASTSSHKLSLIAMGFVVGFLGATPSLLWSMGLMALAMAPVLLPLSVWLYTAVFVFASLWFIHFCLGALEALRAAQDADVFVPTRPITPITEITAPERDTLAP